MASAIATVKAEMKDHLLIISYPGCYPVSSHADNPRITGHSNMQLAKPGRTKTGWVGQKQAVLFGPAGPKLDADQKIRDSPYTIVHVSYHLIIKCV